MRLSTLGVKLGYAVEQTAGTKPQSFSELGLVSSIGGINLDQEQIDVTVIADTIKQYVKGQQDTGGTWELSFIADPDVSITQIKAMFTAAKTGLETGLATWFEVTIPGMSDGFFVVADPGDNIPLPEINMNEALTIPLTLIIREYKGLQVKVGF